MLEGKGRMDAKRILVILGIIGLVFGFPTFYALGGQTTISGAASCVMPDFFEFKTQAADQTKDINTAPIPAGSSGSYEVSKEEKAATEEPLLIVEKPAQGDAKVTVYSIYAK